MRDIRTHRYSMRRPFAIAAALILLLAAGGCERSLRTARDARSPAPSTPPVSTSQATETSRKYIAYYFHRTIRCPTCLSIEKQSREAIELAFHSELGAGALQWHAVNIEEPGNGHFERDFALDRQALVLVELEGEQVQRHKKLERVWELVDDPFGFQEYVVTEVALFLGGG
jgi:hypothetical protein